MTGIAEVWKIPLLSKRPIRNQAVHRLGQFGLHNCMFLQFI